MKATELKKTRQLRRKRSVRRRVVQSGPKVRLSVHRSCKHIYAQVVDEMSGKTLCGTGTTAKSMGDAVNGKTKTEAAAAVGAEIARLAKDKGVETVVFDRGHSKYHGRVKALADAAREGGLRF